jgi:capsular polysaccharide biosynthesis protein
MELRQYWNVIWRRRWLVLAIVVLATLFSAYSLFTAPKNYRAEATFTVRQQVLPDERGSDNGYTFDRYYVMIASEYLVDDYTQVVESDAFGEAVLTAIKKGLQPNAAETDRIVVSDTAKLMSDVDKLKAEDIAAAVGANRRHRELGVFAETPSKDLTKAILEATSIVLTNGLVQPYKGTDIDKPVFAQIDRVTYDDMTSSTSKEITNAIIRAILGLVAAIAIAFLLEYLDNSVRDERDARKILDLPVIGAIPRI